MSVNYYFLRTSVQFVALILIFGACSGYDFDRDYTGVYFSPYVKDLYPRAYHFPYANNYTTKEIEVMLEVIMEKFSSVTTWGSGSFNVSYKRDITYYDSGIEVIISEVAAKINRRRGNKSVTIFQGISYFDYNPRMETEIKLAIECAEKANEIFPGTVEGFTFTDVIKGTEISQAKNTLEYLKELKNSSVAHLKFGTVIDFYLFWSFTVNQLDQNEMQIFQDIFQESDFVTCSIDGSKENKNWGVKSGFEIVDNLPYIRAKLKQNYTADKFELIGRISWASKGYYNWETIQNLKDYWELADHWARKHSIPIHFSHAFDTPNDKENPYNGWWRLTHNSKSDQKEGYIQKISTLEINRVLNTTSDNPSPAEITFSIAVIVGTALGVIALFIFVLISTAFLLIRVRKLQQKLSREDIRKFLEGVPNSAESRQEAHHMNTSAQTFPYDQSYEIKIGQLQIEHDKILGMGEFGCVFKANVKYSPEDCKDVALKIAKDGSSRAVLQGFLSEIKILIYIGKHSNIVSLIGAYTAELKHDIVYIATELCGLGSLQSYLRNHDNIPQSKDDRRITNTYVNDLGERISFQQMVQWSFEIASGMEYLGTKNVVHADLATRNVLLTTEKTAKISDFGLSRRMYNYTNYVKTQQEPLPWRWMAIESLKKNEFSAKSDVWSYGVTLWEIFSMGDHPYSGLTWTTHFVTMLLDGLRLQCPTYATPEIYQLLINCWDPEHDKRPSFTYIQTVIKNFA